MDVRDCYYLAIKELGCKECGGRYQFWDQRWGLQSQLTVLVISLGLCYSLLHQLTEYRLALIPVNLTQKYACDAAVVSLLRGQTLGNNSTTLQNVIVEIHSEE